MRRVCAEPGRIRDIYIWTILWTLCLQQSNLNFEQIKKTRRLTCYWVLRYAMPWGKIAGVKVIARGRGRCSFNRDDDAFYLSTLFTAQQRLSQWIQGRQCSTSTNGCNSYQHSLKIYINSLQCSKLSLYST